MASSVKPDYLPDETIEEFARRFLIERRTLSLNECDDFFAAFCDRLRYTPRTRKPAQGKPTRRQRVNAKVREDSKSARREFQRDHRSFESLKLLVTTAVVNSTENPAYKRGYELGNLFVNNVTENVLRGEYNKVRYNELDRVYQRHDDLCVEHPHLQQCCPMKILADSPLKLLFNEEHLDLSAPATRDDVDVCFAADARHLGAATNEDVNYYLGVADLIGDNTQQCPLFFNFIQRTCRAFKNSALNEEHRVLLVDLLNCIHSEWLDLKAVSNFAANASAGFLLAQRSGEAPEEWLVRKLAYIARCRLLNKDATRLEHAVFVTLPFVLHVCTAIAEATQFNAPQVTVPTAVVNESIFYGFCVKNANRNWLLQRFDATIKDNSHVTDEEYRIFTATTTSYDRTTKRGLKAITPIANHGTSVAFEAMAAGTLNFFSQDTGQLFQWLFEPSLANAKDIQIRDVHRLMQLIGETTERLELIATMVKPYPTMFPRYNCIQLLAHYEYQSYIEKKRVFFWEIRKSNRRYVNRITHQHTPESPFQFQDSPDNYQNAETLFQRDDTTPVNILDFPQLSDPSAWSPAFTDMNNLATSSSSNIAPLATDYTSWPSMFDGMDASTESREVSDDNWANLDVDALAASPAISRTERPFSSGAASSVPVEPEGRPPPFVFDDASTTDVHPLLGMTLDLMNFFGSTDSTTTHDIAAFPVDEGSKVVPDNNIDSSTPATSPFNSYGFLELPFEGPWNVHSGDDEKLSDDYLPIEARITGSQSRRRFVVRGVSAFDRRAQRNRLDNPELKYVAVYEDTVLGEQLGYLSCTSNGDVVDLEYTDDEVRSTLLSYIKSESSKVVGQRIFIDSASTLNNRRGLHRVKVPLTVVYRSYLAEAGETNERPYCVFAYLSQGVQTSEPQFFKAIKDTEQEFTLDIESRFQELPLHTNINFDSYSKYTNEDGIVCLNQAGFASIRLSLLTAKREVILPLVVPVSSEKVVKAELFVRLHDVSLLFVAGDETDIDEDAIQQETARTAAVIRSYINSNRKFYKEHPAVHSNLNNITVFNYRCRNGVVPGCLFDMMRLPQSHEEYFLGIMRIAIQRFLPALDVTSENMETIWLGMDRTTQLRASMSAVTVFSGTADYSSDVIDNNVMGKRWRRDQLEPIDSFDSPRMQQSGDCEDFGEENLAHIMEIKYNRRDFQSRIMSDVHALFQNFIFFSTLCGVSRGSMGHKASDSNGHLTAHECGIAIPNCIFFKALRRSNPNHPILSSYSRKKQELGSADHIYILEGTGNLIPDACTSDSKRKCTNSAVKAFSETSKSNIREQYFYVTDREDNFYKMFINLMTPEFFIRNGQAYFEFLLVDGHEQKRGVYFMDLLNIDSHPGIKVVNAPVIPPEVMNRSLRIMDDNLPRISLSPVHLTTITDEMRAIAQRLTVVNNVQRSRGGVSFEHCVNIQCRFELMTEAKIAALLKDAKSNGLNILCVIEAVSHNYLSGRLFGCYSLFFY